MKNERIPYWRVIESADWPAIQHDNSVIPFIRFSFGTAISHRGAQNWAALICSWMNEHMRLGNTSEVAKFCDPMLLTRLAEKDAQIEKLKTELAATIKRNSALSWKLRRVQLVVVEDLNQCPL